jgi:hypothetical protein
VEKEKTRLDFGSKLSTLQSSTPKFGALSQKKKKKVKKCDLNFDSKLSALQSSALKFRVPSKKKKTHL